MHAFKVFAKFHMREAYTQIELEEVSRKITNLILMMEFFAIKWLSMELIMLFQRTLKKNTGKIKGVKFINDDIILHAENKANLLKTLGEIS